MVFQVVSDLLRSLVGKALLDQRGQGGDMGGCLACAEKVTVVDYARMRYVTDCPASAPTMSGLILSSSRRALAAERLDYGGVEWVIE